jgi:hypothetical protein
MASYGHTCTLTLHSFQWCKTFGLSAYSNIDIIVLTLRQDYVEQQVKKLKKKQNKWELKSLDTQENLHG